MSDDPRRFIVVGVGGTGGWLVKGLAPMIEFSLPGSMLLMIDGDTYEPKNAERQDFDEIGNKAEVQANMLMRKYPNTFIVPDDRWVTESVEEKFDRNGEPVEPDSVAASKLLQEHDVVYAMVDNNATRKVLFDAAGEFDNIDVFTGGNDEELFGSVYHYQRRDGHDITDHPAHYHEEIANPQDRNPGELSCQEKAEIEGGTQLLATNMAVAAFLLARTKKSILDGEEDKESEIMFDLGNGYSSPFDRTADLALAEVH